MHNMNGHPIHLDAQVSELVETSLQGKRVEVLPVGDQFGEPAPGRSARPGAVRVRRHPGCAQPPGQILQGRVVEGNPDRFSVEGIQMPSWRARPG